MFDFNKVKLVSYSTFLQKPELSILEQIAYMARVSNPANQKLNQKSDKLCDYLIKNHHFSPFEMCHVVLEIETTRDISRQILRHRSFSFQEFSGRYANAVDELGLVIRECRFQDPKNRQMSIEPSENEEIVLQFEELQTQMINKQRELYKFCIDNKIAKEQSRVILSEGLLKTKLYMSGTIRSWMHYIEIRSDKTTTQREHYDVAIKCAEAIMPIFPHIMNFVHESYFNELS
jgi:thymidylate synthase (FAD)